MNPVCLKSKDSDLSTWKGSASHHEAVEALVLLPSQTQGDIGEMCDNKCMGEKKANRDVDAHSTKCKIFSLTRLTFTGK